MFPLWLQTLMIGFISGIWGRKTIEAFQELRQEGEEVLGTPQNSATQHTPKCNVYTQGTSLSTTQKPTYLLNSSDTDGVFMLGITNISVVATNEYTRKTREQKLQITQRHLKPCE